MSTAAENYLLDLGCLVKERALNVRADLDRSRKGTEDYQFELGRLTAYYEVLSLMKQQAEAFGLPQSSISFECFDPDSVIGRR